MAALTGWGTSEHTAAAGTRMHAAVAGPDTGPTIVCVHGLGCSHRYFLPVARELWHEARVVAPDLPGFGRTRGPARALDVRGLSESLAAWLTATERGGALLLANSSGCQVVVDLALHAPELLGPMVLVSPTFDANARTGRQHLVRLLADQRRERPGLGPVLARDVAACGARRYLASFRLLLTDPVERKLSHVPTPVLVVRGECDPIVPRRWTEDLVERLQAGRLAEIPGAGHTLNWSAPRGVAELIRPLLRGVAA